MSTVVVICAPEAMRVAVGLSLSLAGYRVVTAGTAEEGLCAVAVEQPELIVVQAEWPDERENGETVVALRRAIRAAHSSLPFVVLAPVDYTMSVELIEDGVVEHVCVPWTEEGLRSSVAYLIGRRKYSAGGPEPTESEIERALLQARGVLSKAARHLGIAPEVLHQRMRKLRLTD